MFAHTPPLSRRSFGKLAGLGLGLGSVPLLSSCAGAGDTGGDNSIVVAIVSNPQMQDAIGLVDHFKQQHPDINVRFVSLPENEARAKITASVATGGGEFDVVMISNYETPMWAENGWLENLQPYADATPGYNPGDFIPSVRDALSLNNNLYSVPFYGESSFVAYRADLFEEAGLTMPAQPTWADIRTFAAALNDPARERHGIVLRGLAGWGEVMAPLDTVINTYGGGWFDNDWNVRLTSPETEAAVTDYVDLIHRYGQAGASTSGYGDCITLFSQGHAAMWYDATAMVSTIEDPKSSTVVGKVGYAAAPVKETDAAGWLYSWSLAIPVTSERKQQAWDFMAWMTSPDYMKLVGNEIGWARVPPGSRQSTYQIPEYASAAEAFAKPTLDAMANAVESKAHAQPVPYRGIQFVGIPEFQDLGTRVAQQISAAIAGQISVKEALAQSHEYAETVARTYRKATS